MYRLRSDGALYKPEELCSSGNTNYGCTAFVGDEDYDYPYDTNPTTVPIETDYLLDVVPREMGPAAYHATAIQAQAIAARSYAYWHIQHGSNINNSTDFQVFVPYYFEYMSGTFPNNPDDPCASSNLHAYQQIVCNTVASRYYISYGDDSPAFTEFFADRLERTVYGGQPYLLGVEDPISTGCDADDDGHGRGMSQKGASRWARGNLCANINNPGEEWSVRWDDYRQILAHCYTGIHIRDSNGNPQTPANRWNMLWSYNKPIWQPGHYYGIPGWIQNTGISTWPSGGSNPVHLSYHWYDSSGTQVLLWEGELTSLPGDVSPGQDINFICGIRGPCIYVRVPNIDHGTYVLKFDMVQGDTWFSEQGWPTFDVTVLVDYDPTGVVVASFTATGYDSYVTLEWETATEYDIIGFNLHRSESEDGLYSRINDEIIPAEGLGGMGASYIYTDTNVINGITYYYKLQSVDIGGWSEFYGPVLATPISVIYVDGNLGTDDPACGASPGAGACKTINYALNNIAASGSIVSVAAGTYTETITLKPGVKVQGTGADSTTINGNGAGPVVRADLSNIGSDVVLSGFTITSGSATNGGGIYIANGASPLIQNNIISNNSADFGGGIYIHYSSPTFSANIIKDNSSTANAGGIYIWGSSPTINGNTIQNNFSEWGGGMFINDSSATISDNIVRNNTATLGGGGIEVYGESTCVISGNVIENNQASETDISGGGGGLEIGGACSPTLYGNIIRGNSGIHGGGIKVSIADTYGAVTAHGNIICGNSGYQFYNEGDNDANVTGNWWGTNSPGSAEIYGPVNYDPWIAMTISANPTAMTVPGSSIVRVAMRGRGYNVPDGTRIDWSTTLGTINPLWSTTTNGWAQTILSSSSTGEATASGVEACGQVVTTTVTFLPPTPCFPSGLFVDFDGDCRVTVVDIMLIASRWRTSCDNPDPDNNPDTPNYEPCYDLDENCNIDIVDIMMVAAHWGETCP